ncbi:MAG: hypothetical protein LBV80_04275 [Deltaproteobacteria bacterium]|nr:hypothetical protein [Deltaproteobacteria bacterium]
MDFSNLFVQVLFESLLLIFLSGLGVCAWFSFAFKVAEASGGKAFYGNLSAQVSQTGLLLGLPVALFLAFLFGHGLDLNTATLFAQATPQASIQKFFTPLLTICVLIGTIILQTICVMGRKPLRKNRSAHALLLLITALAASFAVMASLYLLKNGANPELLQTGGLKEISGLTLFTANISVLLEQLSNPLACSLALSLMAAFICCSLLICLSWILARRAMDDFGRDYYNFILKRCSWPAFLFSLASLIGQGLLSGLLWQDFINSGSALLYLPLAAAALQGLCCVILVVTGLSAAPLRHKLWLVLSLPAFAAAIYLVIRLTHELQALQLLS